MNRIRAWLARVRAWWRLRRQHQPAPAYEFEEVRPRRRYPPKRRPRFIRLVDVSPFRWPPRSIRRAAAIAMRPGPWTRRKQKAHNKVVRVAARYGVVARREG